MEVLKILKKSMEIIFITNKGLENIDIFIFMEIKLKKNK